MQSTSWETLGWKKGEIDVFLELSCFFHDPADVKKRWQEYTEELYKKDLHNPEGVITHLEPDILECAVKWALGSIITNKASGGDGIPVEQS